MGRGLPLRHRQPARPPGRERRRRSKLRSFESIAHISPNPSGSAPGELATKELGPRSKLEVRRHQLDREVSRERLTTVDRQLATLADPQADGPVDGYRPRGRRAEISRPHAVRRLENLERLHLAEQSLAVDPGGSKRSWQETLKRLGELAATSSKRDPPGAPGEGSRRRAFSEAGSAPVEGVIRRKGLHDEQTGAPFIIVETAGKEGHYIQVPPAQSEQLRVGERVRVAEVPAKWLTAPDQVIVREAAAHGGIYNPAEHERRLRLKPVVVAGRFVAPGAIVAVNVRRLERLARHQLVTRTPEGNWKVPPDLLDVLREREKTHPQHRIPIERLDRAPEQARPRGPTLD